MTADEEAAFVDSCDEHDWERGLPDLLGLSLEDRDRLHASVQQRLAGDEEPSVTVEEPVSNEEQEEATDCEHSIVGHCALCERYILLTRHHLIPKSTWSRLERRPEWLPPVPNNHRTLTCDICRPCHSMIHKCHDNWTLAMEYWSVERLLEDPQIYRFCRWASRQKAGKYARSP